MIDKATVNKILEAARIEDVVGDFVTLRRAGVNLKGLCPFHDDRTPSFVVSPAKNICHCFACGEGGSPLNFVMKHEQLSYPDALRYLARKYGIPIEEREQSDEQKQAQNDRDSMFIVNEWAKGWFRHQLLNTPDGRAIGLAYFRQRGFRDDILERFQVGFCPSLREVSMSADALKEGFDERYLLYAPNENDPRQSIGTGLCAKNEDTGRLRDRFRGRVIWPIFSVSGRVAGFGGRVLDQATKGVAVKYLNSPESLIYSKRNELFGYYQARQAISKHNNCCLVEGYTDVMAMHQMGVENVVASSGTALTPGQIAIIRRLTSHITVIYDGDSAGIKASERGIDLILSAGMNVSLLLLPDGDDPDSFARKHTPEEFRAYLSEHCVDFLHFKSQILAAEAKDNPQEETKMVNSIVRSIAQIPDEISRALYIRQAAKNTRLDERMIRDAVNRQVRQNLEELAKERARGAGAAPLAPAAPAAPAAPLAPSPTQALALTKLEALIAQHVMRYGHTRAFALEDEDGNTHTYSIAEYIHYSLSQDELSLTTPLYAQILAEAMAQINEPSFRADTYFINHPNPHIANAAYVMTAHQEQLSRFHGDKAQAEPDNETLAEQTDHLLSELKLTIVRQEIQALITQIKDPAITQDQARYKTLLHTFKEKKEIERALAKLCGDRIMM